MLSSVSGQFSLKIVQDLTTHQRNCLKLCGIVLAALAVRLWLMTGFYGSDDLVYAGAVFSILQGDWNPRGYIGSLRYGMNLPIAASIWLFGGSEYAYILYPLACSLINIALLWRLGRLLFGERAGLYAATLMAFCPLDIIWSGRIQADAPLMMWMSASVLSFLEGCRQTEAASKKRMCLFVLAGLLLGFAYSTKNAALFLSPLYAYCLLSGRATIRDCVAAGVGLLAVVGAEAVYFLVQTGDPFYAFTLQAQFNRKVVGQSSEFTTSIFAYPYWALLAFQHSGLTFHLPLWLSIVYLLRRGKLHGARRDDVLFLIVWFVAVASLLTFYVMSWKPFMLIWKQANYMLMFVTPVVLISAYLMQLLPRSLRVAILAVFIPSSVLFAHIEHEVLAAESFNARATAQFYARQASGEPLYCGLRDCGVVMLYTEFKNRNVLASYENPYGNLGAIADLAKIGNGYISVNPRWLKRSWNSLPEGNRRLLDSPPPGWILVAEFAHNSRGLLNLVDNLVTGLAEYGWLPRRWSLSVHTKLRDAVAPTSVKIYKVGMTRRGGEAVADVLRVQSEGTTSR